jgi:hypothetical protein
MIIEVEREFKNVSNPMYVMIIFKSGSRITQIVEEEHVKDFFNKLYEAMDDTNINVIQINDSIMFSRDDVSFIQVTDQAQPTDTEQQNT